MRVDPTGLVGRLLSWYGLLGAPFAWTPEISGLASHIGVYVGLHEALKTLNADLIVCGAE